MEIEGPKLEERSGNIHSVTLFLGPYEAHVPDQEVLRISHLANDLAVKSHETSTTLPRHHLQSQKCLLVRVSRQPVL